MSAAEILAERVLTAVRLGDTTFDRLAETFDVPYCNFTLRRTVYELRDSGLLADTGRCEGGQTVWAVTSARARRKAA